MTNTGRGIWCKCPTPLRKQPKIDQYSLIEQSNILHVYSSLDEFVAAKQKWMFPIVCDKFSRKYACSTCIYYAVIVCPSFAPPNFLLDMPMIGLNKLDLLMTNFLIKNTKMFNFIIIKTLLCSFPTGHWLHIKGWKTKSLRKWNQQS